MDVSKKSSPIFYQMWICLLFTVLVFSCQVSADKDIYKSCEDVMNKLGGAAKDANYYIETSSGHAVILYCHGFNAKNPKAYLTLPAGRAVNFASVYPYKSLPYDCGNYKPPKLYSKRGRTEFDKVAFDIAATSIIRNDFTFTKTGVNNISFGSAGGMSNPTPQCSPKGVFSVDLSGTPFVIHPKVVWKWEGQFQDGSRNGSVKIKKYEYRGCYRDSPRRLLTMAALTSNVMTVEMCIEHCKQAQYYYAGLRGGNLCYCGNSYSKGVVSRNGCNLPCNGQRYRKCGGSLAISVFTASESHYRIGRCDGYPGSCHPALSDGQLNRLLFLQFNPSHPCNQKRCEPFGVCVALTSDGYFCKCPAGLSGPRCQRRTEKFADNNQNCPEGYQPEVCSCKSRCYGAKLLNNRCYTSNNQAMLKCRYGKPPMVSILEKHSTTNIAVCPEGTTITSCNYWSTDRRYSGGNGVGRISRNQCRAPCSKCTAHAICMKYICGCKNGGTCNVQTQQCKCKPGYTGALCEQYDYCTYWEQAHNKAACSDGGICRTVQQIQVKATGGDDAGDVCQLPFTIQGQTFSRCISNNKIGPPFSCGGDFDGNSTYIDMGQWNPGPQYTIAAWVKPQVMDQKNRLIAGGIKNCNDFGIGYQQGKFQAYIKPEKDPLDACTVSLSSLDKQYKPHQWHSVAVVNTGSVTSLIVNGQIVNSANTKFKYLANSNGFWIGGTPQEVGSNFYGMIKNVKVWNQPLSITDLMASFKKNHVDDTPAEVQSKGLVAHYDLGDIQNKKCNGIDHQNEDWIPEYQSEISGHHCNIKRFIVKSKVFVSHWNGSTFGHLEVEAQSIYIYGELNAVGAGYRGGKSSNAIGDDGVQGESYNNQVGAKSVKSNAGGGGGGAGQRTVKEGGRPGGGGSHGSRGYPGNAQNTKTNFSGEPGEVNNYNGKLSLLYMGSGGGSGGNPLSMQHSPKGGDGGNGGGSISLTAEGEIIIKGRVTAQGGDAIGDAVRGNCYSCPPVCNAGSSSCISYSPSNCYDDSGPGGGGSGGSIHLSGTFVNIGMNQLDTRGGTGGNGARMCGGAGGNGRILIESSNIHGSVESYMGFLTKTNKDDTFKDFSNIGRTVTGVVSTTNPNAVYLGCFHDSKEVLLNLKQDIPPGSVTPEACLALCRKKNLNFSGTKNGNECYCDNKVNPEHRVDDSQCMKQCSGNSRQTCGGTDSLLVFGLKQQLHGIGFFGISSVCKGWCVTSGSETTSPKWGECQDEETVLSNQLTCQCPAGKYGMGCSEDCPLNRWGIDCAHNCSCKDCDSIQGDCHCPKGWTGINCDEVTKDHCLTAKHYGELCKPCDCSGGDCDPVSGACQASSDKLSGGGIAGITIGVLVIIAALVVGGLFYLRKIPFKFPLGPIRYENHDNEVSLPSGFGDDFLENVVNEVNAAASKPTESKDSDS